MDRKREYDAPSTSGQHPPKRQKTTATQLETLSQKAAPPRILRSLKWDSQLRCTHSNSEQLKKWQLTNLPSKWNEEFAFPTLDELTAFADAAHDKTKNEDHKGWKVVMTAESPMKLFLGVARSTESFFARVYFNEIKRQLLVAIKGTTKSNLGDILVDLNYVFWTNRGLQVDSVFTFGEELRKLIAQFKCKPQVFITGQLLGGFLAQVLTFTLTNCGLDEGRVVKMFREDFGLNTIVFNSPAASIQIKQITSMKLSQANYGDLPITNFINSEIFLSSRYGIHVGIVISMQRPNRSKFSRFSYLSSLKVPMNLNLDDAFQITYQCSEDDIKYDPKQIPLLQFSRCEQEALRNYRRMETVAIKHRRLLPSFKIDENIVRVDDDQDERNFIPKLRFFVQQNWETLQNLDEKLAAQFSSMINDQWKNNFGDLSNVDLQLQPTIREEYGRMQSGTRIYGLGEEREQVLFGRILSNSLPDVYFKNYDEFVQMDEVTKENWLRLHHGVLVLSQADGKSINISPDFQTKIIFLDNCAQPSSGYQQLPLKVCDLDDESKSRLGKKKLRFFGNEVEAEKIFFDLLVESNVLDIFDFSFDKRKEIINFYFGQEFVRNIGERSVKINQEILAIQIQKSTVKTFLLSCDAGMGKTTNLNLLEEHLQEKLPHLWIVRLELGSCSESLHKWNNMGQQADLVKAAISLIADEIFKKTEASNAELIRKIFDAKVAAGEVIFVLDAVDEACPKYRTETLELLRLLKKTGLKMLVATRPQEEKEVAQKLGIEGEEIFRLKLIEAEEQAKFIYEFWASKEKSIGLETAKSLLDQLRSRLPGGVPGIPLNLRMIAESFPDGNLSEEFLEHGDLYKTLFESSIREEITKQLGQNKNLPIQRRAHDSMAKLYFNLLQKMAVAEEYGIKKIPLQEDIEFIKSFPFAMAVGDEVRFTHKTFREYLVAVQLVRVMNGEKFGERVFLNDQQTRTTLGDKNCKEIHIFVDLILSQNESSAAFNCREKYSSDEIALACLQNQNLNIFKMLCNESSIWNKLLGRDRKHPLELILGNEKPKKEFLECLFSQGSHLQHAVNDENRHDILTRLIQLGLNERITENWKLFETSLKVPDYNPLVASALCGNLEMARFFIQHGADVNRNDGGDSPLTAAIKNDYTEMANLFFANHAE